MWQGCLTIGPPKSVLFVVLPQARPHCGPRRRWKDVVRSQSGIQRLGGSGGGGGGGGWRALCRVGMESHREAEAVRASVVVCEVCSRTFRRESDCKGHKCIVERRKPVSEQCGSVQCQMCRRCMVQEQGRFGSPHVQTSAAGNVSRDTCCPLALGACVAV